MSFLDVVDYLKPYWIGKGDLSNDIVALEIIYHYLEDFTALEIKGALLLTIKKKPNQAFPYFCGILRNWKSDIDNGHEPAFLLSNRKYGANQNT